jgi:hypothetical protein
VTNEIHRLDAFRSTFDLLWRRGVRRRTVVSFRWFIVLHADEVSANLLHDEPDPTQPLRVHRAA